MVPFLSANNRWKTFLRANCWAYVCYENSFGFIGWSWVQLSCLTDTILIWQNNRNKPCKHNFKQLIFLCDKLLARAFLLVLYMWGESNTNLIRLQIAIHTQNCITNKQKNICVFLSLKIRRNQLHFFADNWHGYAFEKQKHKQNWIWFHLGSFFSKEQEA